jgi:hypothetical protein
LGGDTNINGASESIYKGSTACMRGIKSDLEILAGNLKGRNYFGDLGVDRKII